MKEKQLVTLVERLISDSATYNGQSLTKSRILSYSEMIAKELIANFDPNYLNVEFVVTVMDNGKKEYYGDSNSYPKNVIGWFRKELSRRKDLQHKELKRAEKSFDHKSPLFAKVEYQCLVYGEQGFKKEVDFTRGFHISNPVEQEQHIANHLNQMAMEVKCTGTIENYLKKLRREVRGEP